MAASGRLDEAEDLPLLLVDPVMLVVDPVLRLFLEVFHVSVGDVFRGDLIVQGVDVQCRGA
jgi:hypothetical protein